MHKLQKVKIEAIPGRLQSQHMFPHILILGNGRLEKDEPLSRRIVASFLTELDYGLPRTIGVFTITIGALVEFDNEFDGKALLDSDAAR